MNRLHSVLLGFGLLLLASAAQAQETNVAVSIPFDFIVGHQILPAGEYTVVSAGFGSPAIVIRSNDRKVVSLSTTYACQSLDRSDRTKLVFHTMAGRYFLSQIWMEGNNRGRELQKSDVEVKLAKNNDAREVFVLAASLAH